MEMHQVRYFLAVSRELNFTRAAEACCVSQPALTRAIKLLEYELGGELFRREGRLTHLTELGQRMMPILKNCNDSATSATALAKSIKAGARASLSIGVSNTVRMTRLIPHLHALEKAIDGIEMAVSRGSPKAIADLLKDGSVDVGISQTLDPTWERQECWPLFSEPYGVVCRRRHRLANSTVIELGDLDGESLVLTNCCTASSEFHALLKQRNVRPASCYFADTEADCLALIGAGLGIGLLPMCACNRDELCFLPMDGVRLTNSVSVCCASGRQRSAAGAALLHSLRSADWSIPVNRE